MDGSDFLQLDPRQVARGARTDWLTARIREAVLGHVLVTGSRLPPTRVLAADLRFSRGTVVEAYRRLTEEGLIDGNARAGTIVVAQAQHPPAASGHVRHAEDRSGSAGIDAPRSLDVIDLAAGLPDLASFPRTAWLRAENEALSTATTRQLGYGRPEGVEELRRELSGWLSRSRGVTAPPDRIIVTAGVTGAVSLLAQVLRTNGHTTVAVEDPSAEGSRRILHYWMPDVSPVPVDDDGIETRSLAESGAHAVLVTPAHQYPTGVVLSPDRRRELVAWTRDGENLIIEDDYDAEYRYDRRPVRAVQPLAPDAVAYTASLSKTLAPALRLGWLVPPAHLHRELVELRWATDLGSPALPQLTLALLLANGTLERHLRVMRSRHRVRRDAAVTAIRESIPALHIGGVAAGLHLVVRLPEQLDDEHVAADARAEGVIVQPLSRHYAGSGAPGLIINYAGHHPARLQTAISAIARVVAGRTTG
ncbi:MocR-like pyridoxine biosynthesis transcription factor PdxR [Agromyces albus]|uniref:MocR-like pyridoxine biosynthesis transcription factor PdxR n=1 Tax=Agromyces albus TaxID=205332 RepID=UPI0027D81EA8|nr:PLP-dependent aminotransferase family protein [Agromyces albus]